MILEDVPKGKNIYVFIDAANMWSVVQSVKKVINYEFLKKFLKAEISPKKLKVFYYEDYPQEGTRECSLDPKHKYFTFLKKGLGFTVRKKPLKRIINDDGAITEKGNIDVKLVIDAVHNIKNADIALFFSGDSDFLSLIYLVSSSLVLSRSAFLTFLETFLLVIRNGFTFNFASEHSVENESST